QKTILDKAPGATDTTTVFKSPLRPNENIKLGKIYTDTVRFVNFDDNGDYWWFNIEKNKDTIGLIHNSHLNCVRGDKLEIQWKMDSIWIAGEGDSLAFSEWLVSAKKLEPLQLQDKNIKFLWRKTVYDKELKTEINTIVLNEEYIQNITDPEKATLAYIATFIGNECAWDGKAVDRSNLKCKMLWALDLGYQCSYRHLEFLRFWFRNEKEILKELTNCPTTPDGATVQDTFDEINLSVNGNRITVSFKVSGFNLREEKSWSWTETQLFEFKENELRRYL